jgi:hypothetical protein
MDNGGEYRGEQLTNHLKDKGIVLESIVPCHSENNYIAEQVNRVGTLSLANRLGLGAGICIGNILDTEWGQNLFCIPYI